MVYLKFQFARRSPLWGRVCLTDAAGQRTAPPPGFPPAPQASRSFLQLRQPRPVSAFFIFLLLLHIFVLRLRHSEQAQGLYCFPHVFTGRLGAGGRVVLMLARGLLWWCLRWCLRWGLRPRAALPLFHALGPLETPGRHPVRCVGSFNLPLLAVCWGLVAVQLFPSGHMGTHRRAVLLGVTVGLGTQPGAAVLPASHVA